MNNNNDEKNISNEDEKKKKDEISINKKDMLENEKLRETMMQELLRELFNLKVGKQQAEYVELETENLERKDRIIKIEDLIKLELQNQLYDIKETEDKDASKQMIEFIISELLDEILVEKLNVNLSLETTNAIKHAEDTEDTNQFGKFKAEDKSKTDSKVSDESPWYEQYERGYEFGNSKQVGSEHYDLAWDFGGHKEIKEEDDIIGDFLKLNLADETIASKYNANVDVSDQQKNIFGTSQMLSLNNKLDLENIKYESDVKETPIVPDIEIDYDNLYENIENANAMEKHLQLHYRPFACHVDINCRLRLYELSILLDDSLYEPEYHPALCVRLRNPSAEIKLYAGGKITAAAITASSARISLLKMIRTIEELNYKTEISNFSKNIVHASFCLPFKIDLEALSKKHCDQICRNSETRPFITYKVEGTAIRLAVFPNGYVLVLHSTQHSETRAAIAGILPILAQFKNGYLTPNEKNGKLLGDISFKLLWERKLEEDREGLLLYS